MRRSVTQREVAREAGVSQYTVSMALRGAPKIPEATRRRVLLAAERLGYHLDPLVSAAMKRVHGEKRGYRGELGIIWEASDPELHPKGCLEAIQGHCDSAGYGLQLLKMTKQEEAVERVARIIKARGLDAVIVWEPETTVYLGTNEGRTFHDLLEGTPVVYMGRGMPLSRPGWFVAPDRPQGAHLAVRKALERGYRRPGFVGNLQSEGNSRAGFVAGFVQAIHYLAPVECQIPPLLGERAAVRTSLEKWFRYYKPDVIIQGRDVREELQAMALRLGSDIGYIRLETQHALGDDTCVVTDWAEIGRACVDFAFAAIQHHFTGRVEQERRMLVEGRWVEGTTLPDLRSPLLKSTGPQKPLALRAHLNRPLRGGQAWFGDAQLLGLEVGEIRVDGVRFQIGEHKQSAQPGTIIFESGTVKTGLRELELPVRGVARQISFLHGCGYAGDLEEFATYTILYQDGSSEQIPLVSLGSAARLNIPELGDAGASGANIQDWWPTYPPLPGHVLVTTPLEPGYHRQLYHLCWENPHPKRRIRAVRVQTDPRARSTLALLAVTVSG